MINSIRPNFKLKPKLKLDDSLIKLLRPVTNALVLRPEKKCIGPLLRFHGESSQENYTIELVVTGASFCKWLVKKNFQNGWRCKCDVNGLQFTKTETPPLVNGFTLFKNQNPPPL